MEDPVPEVEIPLARGDAPQWLVAGFEFPGDDQGHVVRFESSPSDQKGIRPFTDLQKALEILRRGELGGIPVDGGNLSIGRDGKVDQDGRTCHAALAWGQHAADRIRAREEIQVKCGLRAGNLRLDYAQ